MTCRDCKHFAVANHKAYCRKRGEYLIPDGYSCPNFESKYQITTTRNPYIKEKPIVNFESPTYLKDIGRVIGTSAGMLAMNTERKEYNKMFKMDKVKKVIFNPPATIVYWFDGTKTIVKVQDGEIFDKEKGFAMACAKKFFGNKGNYYNEFRKHGADNHCYSVHIDLASFENRTGESIAKDVKSAIEDGQSPNEIRELVGLPPVISPPTDAIGKVVKSNIDDGLSLFESRYLQEPVKREKEESNKERIQKKKEYIDDIALKVAVDCRLYVEVVESTEGDVEYEFSFMHDDNKYKYTHYIGYDEFDVYSQEYLGNRLERRIGAWLGELAKAGVEPVKKERE